MIKLTLSLLSAAMFGWISAADAAEELLPKDLQNIESLQRRADKLASGELGRIITTSPKRAPGWIWR